VNDPTKTKLPSPQERLDLILVGLARQQSIKQLCRQAGVSRGLFYRWVGRVRQAGLMAFEAKAPGPKEVKVKADVEAQLKSLEAKIEKLEKEKKLLREEKNHLKLVAEWAQRIIKRQGWGPLPKVESKKNDMRVRKQESSTVLSGLRRKFSGQPAGFSPAAGEFPAAPIGDGSTVSAERGDPGA